MDLSFLRQNETLVGEMFQGKELPPASILLDFLNVSISNKDMVMEFGSRWGITNLFALMREDLRNKRLTLREVRLPALSTAASPADVANLVWEQSILREAFFHWLYRGGEYGEGNSIVKINDGTEGLVPKLPSHVPTGAFLEWGKNGEIVGPLGIENRPQVDGEKMEQPYQRFGVFPLPSNWLIEGIITTRTAGVCFTPEFKHFKHPRFNNFEDYRQFVNKKLFEQERPVWKFITNDIIALCWVELFICVEWGMMGKVQRCKMCGKFFLHLGRRSKKYCRSCEQGAPKKRYEEKKQKNYSEELLKKNHALYRQMERKKISVDDYNNWRLEHGFDKYIPREKSKIANNIRKG